MNLWEYQDNAKRTEKPLPQKEALQHGMLGIITEAGELGDTIKKHVIYGKPLDISNIIEELGDLLWYMAVIANNCDINLNLVAVRNIQKLQRRYPEKYSDADALDRKDKAHGDS